VGFSLVLLCQITRSLGDRRRAGGVITSEGKHSVAVARQYSGTLGKIGNCQMAVTAALWAASRAWFVGAALYLPQAWLDDPARRAKVRIPPPTRFQEKWPRRSLARLVDLVHRRWAIEQQYAETKTELGLDHFEGRSYPGWNHHVVITAVAYAFLQQERGDGTARLTFPQIRAIVQEIFTGLFFAAHPRYLDWIQRARELLPLRLI
jgi:SRSO17 transposase